MRQIGPGPRSTNIGSISLKTLTVAVALTLSVSSYAAFELRNSQPEKVETPAPAFDQAEYEVWVDNTYTAVVEYGYAGELGAAPSYGDPMPLEDALKLLVPNDWKVMKSRDLTRQGRIEVEWDVENADWVGVLENLGEREGLRFHVDYANHEVFIQNGRKLLFDRAFAKRGQHANPDSALSDSKPDTANSTTMQSGERQKSSVIFSVKQGDDAQQMMSDLSNLLGYRKPHWMLGNQTIEEPMTWEGGPMEVLSYGARAVGGRVCLYSDKTIAFVAQSMRCPK
jgi:hypothetical protein